LASSDKWEFCRDAACGLTWLFEWQTLVAGTLAVLAAVVTAWLIKRQITQAHQQEQARLSRQANAARVALPLTLSGISHYAEEAAGALAQLTLQARAFAEGDPPLKFESPRPPSELAPSLERMAGATDDREVVTAIARLLGEIQVLSTRMVFTHEQLSDPSGAVARESEQYLLQAGAVYALAESLFDFARFESETAPPELDWDRVFAAFKIMRLYPEMYPELHRHSQATKDNGHLPHHYRGPPPQAA
jgi:hypothetical protein